MKQRPSFWQRIGLHEWFLKKEAATGTPAKQNITPNEIFRYLTEQFHQSVQELSFANRVVFYHEYIVCFNEEDYRTFTDQKKGIFGIIVQEVIRSFYEQLTALRTSGKTVAPAASKWVFRFVTHPEYQPGDKGFIGKLLPGAQVQAQENIRVTFIPRQTGIAQTLDVHPDILKGFTYYSEGYYEIPFHSQLQYEAAAMQGATTQNALARLETILPDKAYRGKKLEYLMRDPVILISGSNETGTSGNIFKVPSEWVDTPHLRIRHDVPSGNFYLASFGSKTLLNEQELTPSTPAAPQWTELPFNSRMVLNGIVGINFFKG